MTTTIKRSLVGFLNWVSPANPKKTIVVAGSPRSGTTWLAELLRSLPNYKFLNEPLLPTNNPEVCKLGFEWRTCIDPASDQPEARAFFRRVLSGQVPHGPLWHYESSTAVGRLLEHAVNRQLVVKFCRAGRLLHWLHDTFTPRGTVLLIRHPCAVMASMMNHGGWDDENFKLHADGPDAFGGRLPKTIKTRFSGIFEEVDSKLDTMAVTWALDYYIPLVEHSKGRGYPWTLVPYERLVLEGEDELDRILGTMDVERTENVQKHLDVASEYASADLATKDRRMQLSKWRDRLSDRQIDRILEIVTAFGLDFYTDELEPDYERLLKLQTEAGNEG